ncbi:MAG: nicotinamide-nucleotide adenylyltransferase [Patescibacteria group bacterium]|jgi:nicotinamide-nucleotide adenylyltransferase
MKKILFIGRFQPFHLGHLSVIKEIDARGDVDEIIIGIGSSQYSQTDENPYNYETRKKMIEMVLPKELAKKFSIFAIPDVHENNIWVDHVKNIVGSFDEVYTGNELVRSLFADKKYLVLPIKIKIKVSGTKIREMIKNGDEKWKELVPEEIYDYPQIYKLATNITNTDKFNL